MAWVIAIDRGGTFTDVVARAPDGTRHVRKVLSVDPRHPGDPTARAVREVLGVAARASLPDDVEVELRLGTTIATNALLERRGVPVGLAITRGFGDLLVIGDQRRPELFAVRIERPPPLFPSDAVAEIDERWHPTDAAVRRAPDPDQVSAALAPLRAAAIDSLAVVALHAYEAGGAAHERQVAEIARGLGFRHVSCSHEAAAEVGAVARGATTLADAYLTPLVHDYLARLRAELPARTRLRVFQSSGGLTDAGTASGKDLVLSGPAGGAVAAARIGRALGERRLIGFDMGGTSTDVCRVADGDVARAYEATVAGVALRAPMIEVVTVAAGGGSIVAFDGRRLTVGPASAGAEPGPACYGRGGPATLTDANMVLGRVQPAWFPCCFGERGDAPLDPAASHARLGELAAAMGTTPERVAAGAFRVAVDGMAQAIKRVTVARGIDPRDHLLCGFGGAAGQHVCAVADALGVTRVALHPLAGVLSAWGILGAALTDERQAAVGRPLDDETLARCRGLADSLAAQARAALVAQGAAADAVQTARVLDLRVAGADEPLPIAWDGGDPRAAFGEAHARLFGVRPPHAAIEVVNVRVTSMWDLGGGDEAAVGFPAGIHAPPMPLDRVRLEGREAPLWRTADLRPGTVVHGPALLIDDHATTVLDPGWGASVLGDGMLLLRRAEQAGDGRPEAGSASGAPHHAAPDPALLEVFQNRFMSIAEQMGSTLQRVAHSTNIKERLDFSCAVFDAEGALIANAPHIPVHLGAMGESVRALLAAHGAAMRHGDAWVTNDPFRGGSHLPDVTVVTPVDDDAGRRRFYVACRGHHADVGGRTPGSMPPDATRIEDEGVRLHGLLAARGGALDAVAIRAAFTSGPFPARDPDERVRDCAAQVAANAAGVRLLRGLCAAEGADVVSEYMAHVQDDAAEALREVLRAMPPGTRHFADALDDGTPIAVEIGIDGDRAVVDFACTGGPHPGNLNAPRAVTVAAVLYVFRTLIARPIPLNAGVLRPIEIRVPKGSILDPPEHVAVAAGNVETAQRVVDVLLGALGIAAASQGTMNNVTLGDARGAHYETIAGGAGAGPGFAGASGVHTHMTNTRATDPEVLERRHPLVLREFSLRRGSGGAGRWPGGDGVVRAIEARAPLTASVLSERRARGPYGLEGGATGAPGRNTVRRADGRVEDLPGRASLELAPGDTLIIETPGGGGYGEPEPIDG